MVRWIFNNIPLKIISIILALLLWFHVVTERRVEETIEAPVLFSNLPANLIIVKGTDVKVNFRVVTKVKQLILLEFFGHPFMNVDLSNVVLGENTIASSVESIALPSWRPLDITGIIVPKDFTIVTEEKVHKKVVVNVVMNEKPQEGIFIKNVVAEPESIILIGGDKKLKNVNEVLTDTVNISGKKDDFTIEKQIIIPDGSFSTKTDKIKVSIIFKHFSTKRLMGVKLIIKGDENYELFPKLIDVDVSGPENLIRDLSPSDIKAYVDSKGSERFVTPYFNLPEGIVFKSSNPSTVEIRLKKKKSE